MADMSERTMWKDDLHGLLLGASLVDIETRDNEDEVMRTLRDKIASTIWKHEWDMFAYGPGVSTDPLEVQFLKALSMMEQPLSDPYVWHDWKRHGAVRPRNQ